MSENLANPTLSQLAETINTEHRACEDAVRTGLDHAIRAGELLTEAKSRLDHGQWNPWVEANCTFTTRTAQGYMKVAANRDRLIDPNTKRVSHLSYRDALKQLQANAGDEAESVHFSSKSDDWATPGHIVEHVVEVLGGIDLDPCSDDAKSVPATTHYTKRDDGLSEPWRGRVFMNPPYGQTIGDWITKLIDEYENGDVTEAIALLPSRTDTKWFVTLASYPKCFVTGRLKFGGGETSAPFPSMAVYFGNHPDVFGHRFEGDGVLVRQWTPRVRVADVASAEEVAA